jgi:hypothetical protein
MERVLADQSFHMAMVQFSSTINQKSKLRKKNESSKLRVFLSLV